MNEDDASPELEAVVRPDRPVLIVQDGDFEQPPAEWAQLNDKRDVLREIIASVGRLELAESNRSLGTAFVVGDGILMTNRHIVQDNFAQQGGRFTIPPGSVRIDFHEEHERPTPSELLVDSVIGIHARYDLALLGFTATEDSPDPVVLERTQPTPLRRNVVVIGYPDRDFTATDDQVRVVFHDILSVKRLQPGQITGPRQFDNNPVIGHDCSTLGGNSGSCMADLETGRVLGLHFGGTTVANLAVPLWRLADEPMMRNLNWVDREPPLRRRRRAVHS